MTIKSWKPGYHKIVELSKDTTNIYVFGSNTKGVHGAGSALIARQLFDAAPGKATGLQGRSYAIVTKVLSMGLRSVSLEDIQTQILNFYMFAAWDLGLDFYVDRIGCGLAGYKYEEIKPLFHKQEYQFDNLYLPEEFV